MGRASRDLDLEPCEALVRHADLERGRLGHDRRVGVHLPGERLRADACELLVADRRHDHVACELEPRRLGARPHGRRDAALHVEAAAPVEAVALDARVEWTLVAVVAHGVRVAVEQQRAPTARAARDAGHVRAPRRDLVDACLDAGCLEPAGDEARDLQLARASGHELRIDRVDGDQVRDECTQCHGSPTPR